MFLGRFLYKSFDVIAGLRVEVCIVDRPLVCRIGIEEDDALIKGRAELILEASVKEVWIGLIVFLWAGDHFSINDRAVIILVVKLHIGNRVIVFTILVIVGGLRGVARLRLLREYHR